MKWLSLQIVKSCDKKSLADWIELTQWIGGSRDMTYKAAVVEGSESFS
jgi:hypothetical protein